MAIYFLDPINTIYFTLTDSPPSFPYELVSSLNDDMRDPDNSLCYASAHLFMKIIN